MSKGKKRRRPQDRPRPAPRAEERAPAPQRRGLGSFLFRPPSPPVFPPIRSSLGRGLLGVASSPALLVSSFLLVGAVWLVLIAVGFESSPARLVHMLAIAPLGTQFDVGVGGELYGNSVQALLVVNGLIVVRSVVVAVITGAVVEALEGGRVSGSAVARGLRAFAPILGLHIASFGLLVVGNLLLPTIAGPLGVFAFVFVQYLVLVVLLAAFAFVPVAAVRERRPIGETFRRAWRAARLPTGHFLLVLLYVTLSLFVLLAAPGGATITANPSAQLWTFILVGTYLHVSFMAVFAYRWILVENEVPEVSARRR